MKPLGSRVLATQIEPETTTSSGLFVGTAAQKQPIATVVSIGPDVTTVKKGDVILYDPSTVSATTFDGTVYLVVREGDVVATVDKELV